MAEKEKKEKETPQTPAPESKQTPVESEGTPAEKLEKTLLPEETGKGSEEVSKETPKETPKEPPKEEPKTVPLQSLLEERKKGKDWKDKYEGLSTQVKEIGEPREPAPQQPEDINRFVNPATGEFDLMGYDKFREERSRQVSADQTRQALDQKEVEETYPQIKDDDELAKVVLAYAVGYRTTLKAAADKIMGQRQAVSKEAAKEGETKAKSELSEKERATTAETGRQPSEEDTVSVLKERHKTAKSEPARKTALHDVLKEQHKKAGRF